MEAELRLLDLVGAMEDLKAMRNSVLRGIELQEGKGKQRTQKVQAWLDKAVYMDRSANLLMIDFSRCCVTGCCSLNIYSRLNASRKATKLKKEIDELMKEKIHLSVLAKRRPSNPIIDMPISTTNVGIMIGSNLCDVCNWLAAERVGIIGIYGMGGVGKSTLLTEIQRSKDVLNMGFDYIIHAGASYELHAEDLRDCIAEQLLLCEPSREAVFKFLKYKNFLLLLDDLWEELDITVLGIPDPHDESYVTTTRYKQKVVFTTRSKKVCDCMKADETIKLECLDKDEGWQLFKENLAMDLEGMPFIEEAARKVASFCGGLPLALMMVGQAMSKKTAPAEWNLMLDQLQGRLSSSLCETMFLYLKGSYDSLANETLQQCFLCFCLWPKKKLISTEDIIKCWLGFGLISCFDSLSEAYMHGCYILEILEEASLVVTHDNKRVAKVHEVIHDMAQWIASRAGGGSHKPWFVRQNITLEQLSSEEVEAWFQLERVSVGNCNLNCLPHLQFECPSLLSLNIQHNQRLENLPKIFLRQMSNLTYLNLSSTGIHELPTEISTHLFNLEFLDISCTKIKSLPHELGNLKKLKYLFCGYLFLGKLQAGLLSNLYSLQVLDLYPYGYVEPKEFEILRGFKGIGMCASSDEIFQQLSHLPIVNINIQEIEGLQTIQLRSLTSEGHGWPKEFQIRSCITVQNLVITNGTKINLKFLRLFGLPKLGSFIWRIEPKEVFPMLQLVQIEACHTLTSLHWVLHLPLLCVLLLKNCDAMEELVDEEVGEIEEDNDITKFPKLKYLTIVHLPKLVKISSCALDFPHLSKVHLEDCPNLKRLPFKPDIVNNQGLLIKCEKKWWDILEWDDASIQSQFRSNNTEEEEIAEFFVGNAPTEDEEIEEFFVGNVPTEDEEIAEYFAGNVPTNDKEIVQFFVDPAPTSAQEGSPTISSSSKVREEDEKVTEFVNLFDEITQLKGEQSKVSFIEQHPPKPVPESDRTVGKEIGSNVDIARSYLADERVGIIGIWGMGGVGKTTLLKKIYKSLLGNANMGFDHVLFIEALQGMQLQLREEIAKKLHLPISASLEDIFNALETKNIVLLLDNIWESVDNNIPVGRNNFAIIHHFRRYRYKYKVIFTTRSRDLCVLMGASIKIKVEFLEPNEAWDLFKDNVNLDVIESDEKFKEIARQVMRKCGGLPLALKVVGKAMSNKKSVQDWEFILNSIKNSGIEVVQGMQKSLLPILKFSYDNLPQNIQECFLCASILQWSSKDDMLECWMGLGLIGDFVNLQQAYDKAEYILKILEESCLLYFSDDSHVHLHEVIYEMAKWIASDCGRNMNKWIVETLKSHDPFPIEISSENWRFANRVIISGREFFPILSHQCSDLLCLMIKNTSRLRRIRKGFFSQMPNLTYLDLGNTVIRELPKDIKCLVNLQYLNISSTNISSLPKELVYLKKLQYLICRNTYLSMVEDGLMSRLQKLNVIDLYPYGWVEPEELKLLKKHNRIKAIGMRVVSQEVLQQLSCLPTTRLYIENLDNMISLSFDTLSCKDHGFLQELKIESCPQLEQIVMNGSGSHLNKFEISNVEKLQNIIWTDLSSPEYFHVLKKLSIIGCNVDNLAWVLHLPCLSFLYIEDCAKIETLFYMEEREIQQQEVSEHRPTFPALEDLRLEYLPKLVSISNFALDFPRLTLLQVRHCLTLKKLPFKSAINNNNQITTFIHCEREWWESLEWNDATIPSHLLQRSYFLIEEQTARRPC